MTSSNQAYVRNPQMPSDPEGLNQYLTQELEKIQQAILDNQRGGRNVDGGNASTIFDPAYNLNGGNASGGE